MSKRRNFIKNSTGIMFGSILLPEFLTSKDHADDRYSIQKMSQPTSFLQDNLLFGEPIIRTVGPGDIMIQAYSLVVDGAFFKGLSKNLHLLCHDLTMNGDIEVINGKNINITCVNLKPTRDVSITSTGTHGESAAKDLDGQNLGENGKDADNVITGSNSYKITGGAGGDIRVSYSHLDPRFKLKIFSRGGSGGKGEDGGYGRSGGVGSVGHDARRNQDPSNGGNGQNGGKGGNGAQGGQGGDGGHILLTRFLVDSMDLKEEIVNSNFELLTLGGEAGLGGSGGKGAEGGLGGIGGRFGSWVPRGHPRSDPPDSWVLSSRRGQVGAKGIKGDDGENGKSGLMGRNGTISQQDISIGDLSNYLTVSYLKLLMLKGESLYINSKIDQAAHVFLFLTQVNGSGLNNSTNQLYFSLSKFSFTDENEKSHLISKAGNYVYRIGLSLDYWGKGLNYVPRLTKAYLKNELTPLIAMGVSFEELLQKFYNRESLSVAELKEISSLRQKQSDSIVILKSELEQKKQFTFYTLQQEIMQFNEDIERRVKLLEKAERRFKDAVKERNKKKCGFSEVISAVQIVVSIGTAVSSFGVGILATVNAVNTFNELNANADDTLKGKWGVVKGVEKIAKEAAGSFSSSANALDKIEDNYAKIFAKQKEDLAETTNLIALENDEFEKLMDKYIDMPEARQYKAEMRQYVNAINSRNKKRLDYTNNILELDKIRLEIGLLEAEQQKLLENEFMTASEQAPGELQLLMLNQYYNVRGQIIRLIFLLERSIEFYSLKSRSFSFADMSIGSLQSNIIDSRLKDLENDSALGSGLNLFPNTARVTLTKEKYPLIFDSLKEGGKDYEIDFYISPDDIGFIGEYSNIRIKNVRVFIDRVTSSGDKISMKLTHMGNSSIRNSNRKLINFMHDSVNITLDYYYNKPEDKSYQEVSYLDNITGIYEDSKAKYSLISPFANWKLSIKRDVNLGVNLARTRKIELAFDFYAGPRN